MLGGRVEASAFARRLLSRRLQPAVVGLIAAAGGFAVLLGVDYAAGSSDGRLDRAIGARLVARFGSHEGLVHGLIGLGAPVPIVIVTVSLVAGLVLSGRLRAAMLAALAPAVAGALTELILKPLLDQNHAGQSFPSGHATGVGAVAFVAVVLVLDQRPRRLPWPLQVIVSIGALGLLAGVSAALVAARYHTATDTLGGACVALVSVLTLALVIDNVADRRTLRKWPTVRTAQRRA